LLDADQVAGRVAEGAIANPARLLDRLLHDLPAGLTRPGAVQAIEPATTPETSAAGAGKSRPTSTRDV
jgi:hypothetical protein